MNDYKELIADLRDPNKVLRITFVNAEQKWNKKFSELYSVMLPRVGLVKLLVYEP